MRIESRIEQLEACAEAKLRAIQAAEHELRRAQARLSAMWIELGELDSQLETLQAQLSHA